MTKFIIKRFLSIIPTILIVITVSFFLNHMAPGGPFDGERNLPVEVLENLEKKYHLDEPLMVQYLRYMGDVLRGDFGPSFRYIDHDVNYFIYNMLPVSLHLGFIAMIGAIIFGVSTGVISALRQNTIFDYLPMSTAVIGISIPNFVVGPVLMYVFALKLHWLPTSGWISDKGWITVIMPAFTLGFPVYAYISRIMRASVIEVLRSDYIRTAQAKGLSSFTVIWRHMLKGSILPVVTYLGPAFSVTVTGGVVVETIFRVPGLGPHFVSSAFNRDYTMIMGTVIVFSVILIVANFLVDIAYSFLDPRISYQ